MTDEEFEAKLQREVQSEELREELRRQRYGGQLEGTALTGLTGSRAAVSFVADGEVRLELDAKGARYGGARIYDDGQVLRRFMEWLDSARPSQVPLELEDAPLHRFHRVFMRAVGHNETHRVQVLESCPAFDDKLRVRCTCGARLELDGRAIAAKRITAEVRGLIEAVPTDHARRVEELERAVRMLWDELALVQSADELAQTHERVGRKLWGDER